MPRTCASFTLWLSLSGVAALFACSESEAVPGSCNCPASQSNVVHQPLYCACGMDSTNPCPARIEDALATLCPAGANRAVIRAEGCGMVSLGGEGSFGGVSRTFDAESGVLIGVYQYSDVGFGNCNAYGYVAGDFLFVGEALDVGATCSRATYCMACGAGAYPACPAP